MAFCLLFFTGNGWLAQEHMDITAGLDRATGM